MPSISENTEFWGKNYVWPEAGDEWSEFWGTAHAQWFGCLLPRVFPFLKGRVLEIAPGHGRWTQFLQAHCESLIGIDLASSCVEKCTERFASHPNLEFQVNNGLTFPAIDDRSIDFAFSYDSLVHAESDVMSSYVKELARVLKPGGVAFLHHSNRDAVRSRIALYKAVAAMPLWCLKSSYPNRTCHPEQSLSRLFAAGAVEGPAFPSTRPASNFKGSSTVSSTFRTLRVLLLAGTMAAAPLLFAQAPSAQQTPSTPQKVVSGTPIAIVPLDNTDGGPSVTGALQVSGGRAIIVASGSVTSGTRTTEVALPRRGTLRVCASTTVKLAADSSSAAGDSPSLLMAMDAGAVEMSFATAHSNRDAVRSRIALYKAVARFTGASSAYSHHWRARSMSAEKMRDFVEAAGMMCVQQEIVPWGTGWPLMIDCMTTIMNARGSSCRILHNPRFMEEAATIKQIAALGASAKPGTDAIDSL